MSALTDSDCIGFDDFKLQPAIVSTLLTAYTTQQTRCQSSAELLSAPRALSVPLAQPPARSPALTVLTRREPANKSLQRVPEEIPNYTCVNPLLPQGKYKRRIGGSTGEDELRRSPETWNFFQKVAASSREYVMILQFKKRMHAWLKGRVLWCFRLTRSRH